MLSSSLDIARTFKIVYWILLVYYRLKDDFNDRSCERHRNHIIRDTKLGLIN